MPKALQAATPSDVLEAIAGWTQERIRLANAGVPSPLRPDWVEAFLNMLEENKAAMCATLVNHISSNPLSSRILLSDVAPAFKEFLKDTYNERILLDTLRDWFASLFGQRIRVEGDMAVGGLFLHVS